MLTTRFRAFDSDSSRGYKTARDQSLKFEKIASLDFLY